MSTSPLAPPEDDRVKVAHLVLGLLFLGVVGAWALISADVLTTDQLTVLAPGLLIAAGVFGLMASLVGTRRRNHKSDPYDRHDPLADRGEDPTEEIR